MPGARNLVREQSCNEASARRARGVRGPNGGPNQEVLPPLSFSSSLQDAVESSGMATVLRLAKALRHWLGCSRPRVLGSGVGGAGRCLPGAANRCKNVSNKSVSPPHSRTRLSSLAIPAGISAGSLLHEQLTSDRFTVDSQSSVAALKLGDNSSIVLPVLNGRTFDC